MKKIIAMLLAVVMAAAMVVPAFADTENTTINSAKNHDITVNGVFKSASASGEVISVGIAWDAMTFTYSEASSGTWDPTQHTYTGNSTAGWSDNKSAITITNHSNVPVDAEFSFTAESGVTTTGKFYHKTASGAFSYTAEPEFRLTSAVGTAVTAAPSYAIYFGVEGAAISNNTTLGNITVTISKSKIVTSVSVDTTGIAEIATGDGTTFADLGLEAVVTYNDTTTARILLSNDEISIYRKGDTTPTLISANDDISLESKTYYVEYEGVKSNDISITVGEQD